MKVTVDLLSCSLVLVCETELEARIVQINFPQIPGRIHNFNVESGKFCGLTITSKLHEEHPIFHGLEEA